VATVVATVRALPQEQAAGPGGQQGSLPWWLPPVAGMAIFLPVALGVTLGGPLPPGDGGLFYLMARQWETTPSHMEGA
jgi:hypothetical protein